MNEQSKPRYHLKRILVGPSGIPEVFPVETHAGFNRREVLRIGTAVPATAALSAFLPVAGRAASGMIQAHLGAVFTLLVSPSGDFLFSAARNGEAKKWTLPDGELSKRLALPGDGLWDIAPNGTQMAQARPATSFSNDYHSLLKVYGLPEFSSLGSESLSFAEPK